jgi:hypothetical protein
MAPAACFNRKALDAVGGCNKLPRSGRRIPVRFLLLAAIALAFAWPAEAQRAPASAPRGTGTYADLLKLNDELQAYMVPAFTSEVVLESGARVGQGYSETAMRAKLAGLETFEQRLQAMNVAGWPRSQQVDWLAVSSMLNGYRFNLEVLKPWKRDPGFYLDPLMKVAFSEVPARGDKLAKLKSDLAAVPPMLADAKANLNQVAGDFADLALRNLERSDGVNHYHPYRAVPPAGIIGWYDDLLARAKQHQPGLVPNVAAALGAIVDFRDWLRANRASMNAPGGVGNARLQWFLTHVRMLPYSVDELLVLSERERERMTADLALTRHRNRNLPEIALSRSKAEQEAKVAETDRRLREFLVREQIVTIPDYVGELGSNTPYIERPGGPNFWEKIQFRDPIPDHLHAVIPGHRFDAEIGERDKRPIRSIYSDGIRAEGWAMYLEEAMMTAGAVTNPRAEEFIYLFGIFRAARVPADINMQRNLWSVPEAVAAMRAATPWLDEDVARVDAEIYLRHPPGYGLAYLTGKLQMDALLAEEWTRLGDRFTLRDFHDRFLAAGRLPIALIRYEMSGENSQLEGMWRTPPIPRAN